MARSRTRRTRGAGLFDSLASNFKARAERSGLTSTPEYQVAATMARGATSAYRSPVGQAVRQQAAMTARQAIGVPAPMAQPVAPVPMAQPVAPAPAPMAQVAAPSLSPEEVGLATIFLVGQTDESFRKEVADAAARIAVNVKNRDKNLALLDGIAKVAAEVKALHDSGAPMGASMRVSGNRKPGALAQLLPMLEDAAVRSRVAAYLVAAREPGPNERRFLAGSINQLATAVRIAFQQKLLLGGKTRRRARKSRATRRR